MVHRQTSPRAQRGFTLVEVLVALGLLVTGLLSAYMLITLGVVVNADAKATTNAYQAAQHEIEILRNMPYATLQGITQTASNPEDRFLTPAGTADASRPGDIGYPGQVSALGRLPQGTGGLILRDDAAAPAGFGNACKRVTVVVRWLDRNNVTRSVSVGTIIAQGGINVR